MAKTGPNRKKFSRKAPIMSSKPTVKRVGIALSKLGRVFKMKKYRAENA